MRLAQRLHRKRPGFTLVELMVVIAIIAILVTLVTVGVLKFLGEIPHTQTVNEIRQMAVGLENFKAKYKIYPPSKIFLSNNPNDFTIAPSAAALTPYAGVTLGQFSQQYLSALWPRIQWNNPALWNSNPAMKPNPALIDWGGGKVTAAGLSVIPQGGLILEGDQCLVYFLSGPSVGMYNGAPQVGVGWSTNPANPTQLAAPGTGNAVGPFFEFNPQRLVSVAHATSDPKGTTSPFFLSYYDPYATVAAGNVIAGAPYAFFSSGRNSNYFSDCPSLLVPAGMTLTPYSQSISGTTIRYYNPNTFQIISAGQNQIFGPGGLWPNGGNAAAYLPGNASVANTVVNGSGADDLSNFSGDYLGNLPQ